MPGASTPSRGLAHPSAGMNFEQEGYSPTWHASSYPVAAMAGDSTGSALEQELLSPAR